MANRIFDGSLWKNVKALKLYNGTAWKNAVKGWVWNGTNWKQWYPEYPVNTVSPSVSGSTIQGNTLTVSTGTWNSDLAYIPTSYSYQWTRAGVDISGATSSTYTTVLADVGNAVSCKVTGINNRGSTTVSSSNSITIVSATYTVTWNANGGSVTPSSSAVNVGSSVIAPTPTRANYTFNGWYNAASGGSLIVNAGASYTPTSDITLYAQWTIIQYTVTWNANGGSVSPTSSTVNAGSSVTAPTPTRSGYTFNGWYNSASGGSLIVSAGNSYTPTSSTTLYAQWTIIQYVVTWSPNSGTVSPTSSTVNAGSSVTAPTPTRSNYTFNGWYTASSGGSLVVSAGNSYTPTSTITLYAQWTIIQYTVTWDANGGTVSPTSSTVNAGSSVNAPTPTRSGYTFNEWRDVSFGDPTVTVAAGGSYTPSYNITFYARWTAAAATAPTTPTNGGGTFTSGTNYVTNATFTSSSAGTTPITYYWTVSSSTSSSGPWSQRNTGNFSSSSLSTTLSIPQQSWVQATYGNWSRYTVYASNSAGNSGTLTWTI